MSVKHYQIGDRIRDWQDGREGVIFEVTRNPLGHIGYGVKNDSGRELRIAEGYAELIEPPKPKAKPTWAEIDQAVNDAWGRIMYGESKPAKPQGVTIADVEEIASRWAAQVVKPFISAVASHKPDPKFKVGDQVRHTIHGKIWYGEVVSIGERDGVPICNVLCPEGLWYAPESYLELIPIRPAPKLYTATYRRDDGLYGLQFEARSEQDAEAHCKALGMTYGGIVA